MVKENNKITFKKVKQILNKLLNYLLQNGAANIAVRENVSGYEESFVSKVRL
jgi:hypothetical protein